MTDLYISDMIAKHLGDTDDIHQDNISETTRLSNTLNIFSLKKKQKIQHEIGQICEIIVTAYFNSNI